MTYLLSTFVIVISAIVIFSIFRWLKGVSGKQTTVGMKIVAPLLYVIFILLGLGAVAKLWPLITEEVPKLLEVLNIAVHPLFTALLFVFLLAGLLVALRYMVVSGFTKLGLPRAFIVVVDVFTAILAIYAGIKIMGLGVPENGWWFTWHIFFAGVAIAYSWRYLQKWHSDKKHRQGLTYMYIFNILLSVFYGASFGHDAFSNMAGTPYGMAAFLGVNFIFAWLNFGIGNPEKKIHTRWAYIPLMLWMFVLLGLDGRVVYYQVTNQMSLSEMEVARITNLAGKKLEDMQRNDAMADAPAKYKAFLAAEKGGNTKAAEKYYQALLEENKEQANIQRAKRVYPEAMDGHIMGVSFSPSNQKLKIGEFSEQKIPYYTGTYKIRVTKETISDNWIEPKGDVVKLESLNNDFELITPDGQSYSPWRPDSWPKNFVFKILAHSNQLITIIIG